MATNISDKKIRALAFNLVAKECSPTIYIPNPNKTGGHKVCRKF